MIVVRIELWPGGDEARKRPVGLAQIANIGGSNSEGTYRFQLMKSPEYSKRAGVWKSGRVEGFKRLRLGPFDLLLSALIACIAEHFDRPLPSLATLEAAAEADGATGLALFDAAGGLR